VYVVATNEARRGWRREQRAQSDVSTVPTSVDDATGALTTALDVRAALTLLTDRQRAAVVLRYLADLPIAEIAEVMDCAPGTVKATLHQALARMRVGLEDDDED
jgi:RNA polymerase sigma factor (sigma-70 family)